MRKAALVLSLLILLSAAPLVGAWTGGSEGGEGRLRFAAAQHEIIAILINEAQYDRVLPEYEKILALRFSGEDETLVVKEAWSIAKSLADSGNYTLAHRVLEATLESMVERESDFSLLMFKGKLLKQEGKTREALLAYRQAQALQQ